MQSLHTVGAGLIGLAFFNPLLPGLSGGQFLPTAVRVIAVVYYARLFLCCSHTSLSFYGRTNWKRKDPKNAGG